MDNSKYQFSIKLDDGSIYVVRTNSREELEDEILYIKGLITNQPNTVDKIQAKIDDMRESLDQPEETFVDHTKLSDQCEIHNVKMKERNGKNGKFYSHAHQLKDSTWDYCSGKGFRLEHK